MDDRGFEPRPTEGLNYPNVVEMFMARVRRSGDRPALRHKREGAWRTLTWSQWAEASAAIAAGLVSALGIERGDRVAIMASSRLEWALVDVAIAMAGAVSVPIYPSLTADHTTYILQDSGCKVAIVEHPEHVRRITGAEHRDRIGELRHIVYLDDRVELPEKQGGETVTLGDLDGGDPPMRSLDELREQGAAAIDATEETLEAMRAGLGLDDEFTYVYTSGTTGKPKGVVLTHRNLVYESWAIRNVVPVDSTDEQLMILPLAHIFARHLVWGAMEQGSITAFAESIDKVAANLQEVAPTYMGAVPRIYEKVYDRIRAGVAEGGGVKRTLFNWALEVGRKVSVCKQRGQVPSTGLGMQMAAAQRLVLDKVKAVFGGRLRFFVSGGAPLSREIAEFFHAAGVLILEGYGLTETTGATNVNRPDRFRFGTVGPAMPGCSVRIADDGEVLVRGHNVMARYHNLPEETGAAIDERGWFHTGDVGELTDGFLRITDRKKDLIKTAGGKYIAPQPIENRLKVQEGISQVMVYGESKPYAVALVTLDEDGMMKVSEREGLGCRTYADLAAHPRIRKIISGYVDDVNAGLASFETVKKFAIPPADFTEATGELTPTLKVRRKVVLEKYGDLIESLYTGTGESS